LLRGREFLNQIYTPISDGVDIVWQPGAGWPAGAEETKGYLSKAARNALTAAVVLGGRAPE
jgi:hypothetical protein